jgi:hypothetical protein
MNKLRNKNGQWLVKLVIAIGLCTLSAGAGSAAVNVPEGAVADTPVKEVTIFKDGHVFVLHEGQVPTNNQGNVVLDYLPRPILGTFWAYEAESKAELAGVLASRRVVSVDRTALTIRELVEANIGAKVRVTEAQLDPYQCTIVGVPARSTEELTRTSPPGTPEELPQRGDIVLLKYEGGVKAVPIERIRDITFVEGPDPTLAREEFRNIMTLKLNWDKDKPAASANVGMVYVQRGIRWIPSYRIDTDGKGNAVVKLQATLINELVDVENVKAHLVIGVPSFAFEETPDPISLQDSLARLSRFFRGDSQMRQMLSNTIMTQISDAGEAGRSGELVDLGTGVTGSAKNEDLYVFTVDGITLKKGQRMVLPVAEFKLKYSDVFTLDLPFGPPPEVRRRFDDDEQRELAKRLSAPKAIHKIRLVNKAQCPLTTAPALLLRNGRVIAQAMMTYTPIGASVDLELTTAVDISVKKLDKETGRTPKAVEWDEHTYERIELAGSIKLTNHRDKPVYLEVRRSILGNIDSASHDGLAEQLGRHEGGWMTAGGQPFWWRWFNWPSWWYHFNGVGRITWKTDLQPKKTTELQYKYHYFWRP